MHKSRAAHFHANVHWLIGDRGRIAASWAVRRRSVSIGYFATAAGCFALCTVALVGSSLARHEGGLYKEVASREAKTAGRSPNLRDGATSH